MDACSWALLLRCITPPPANSTATLHHSCDLRQRVQFSCMLCPPPPATFTSSPSGVPETTTHLGGHSISSFPSNCRPSLVSSSAEPPPTRQAESTASLFSERRHPSEGEPQPHPLSSTHQESNRRPPASNLAFSPDSGIKTLKINKIKN